MRTRDFINLRSGVKRKRIVMSRKDFAVRFFMALPSIVMAILLGHVTLLLFNIETVFAEIVEVSMGFVAVLFISWIFNYCLLHKIQIMFSYFVTACVWWQKYTPSGFGTIRHAMHLLVLTAGVFILTAAVIRISNRLRGRKKSRGKQSNSD